QRGSSDSSFRLDFFAWNCGQMLLRHVKNILISAIYCDGTFALLSQSAADTPDRPEVPNTHRAAQRKRHGCRRTPSSGA
ncbi:MAG: hypothetical protein WAU59_05745, partial [Rhodoplanes sp.]